MLSEYSTGVSVRLESILTYHSHTSYLRHTLLWGKRLARVDRTKTVTIGEGRLGCETDAIEAALINFFLLLLLLSLVLR